MYYEVLDQTFFCSLDNTVEPEIYNVDYISDLAGQKPYISTILANPPHLEGDSQCLTLILYFV